MYKLMIVDDEAFIADGLYRTFLNLHEISLDVYRCYSAKSALAILDQYRMDIVITDINMPGLSGLDMLKEIKLRWPDCRTIILSGYNEFDYAQTALRYGADFYILKSDGDQVLIDAVKSCISKIEASIKEIKWKEDVNAALKKAAPILQQNFIRQLLSGEIPAADMLAAKFTELQIPLNPDAPVHLTAARLDTPDNGFLETSGTINTAIDSIFKQTTAARLQSIPFVLENTRYMLWIIQARNTKISTEITVNYINGILETVQNYCRYALNLSVSFLLEPAAIPFEELPRYYQNLHFILMHKLNPAEEMVLGNTIFYLTPTENDFHTNELLLSIGRLSQLLECQNKKEFLDLFQKLLNKMMNFSDTETQILLYHNLSSILLNQIIQSNKYADFIEHFQNISIFSLSCEHWDINLYEKFLEIADWIFFTDDAENSLRYKQTLDTIHNYIDQHLSEAISLAALAEQVYLNPVYLSRAYKQITGQNISKYISDRRIEKARILLANSNLKISEIACQVGYESPAHFSRIFKKMTGVTPQEFREHS